MSPKERLHLDKNIVQSVVRFVMQPQMQGTLDLAILEMAHQLSKSREPADSLHWKQAGALEFCQILLNLGNLPEIPKRQPPTQLNHNA
jgi:hypothetical protein